MLGVVLVSASSCEKYLDINENPNNFTSATPAIVLPQAIVSAAAISNNFSNSFGDFSGARANAGGFGGFGSVVTYDFGTGDFQGLWTSSYDNANDFEYVITSTAGDPALAYSTAIARIMKSFAFERLVNQFNNVPYTDALKGTNNLQPKYDDAVSVYKACIADLSKAIADITAAQAAPTTNPVPASADPMFGGSTTAGGDPAGHAGWRAGTRRDCCSGSQCCGDHQQPRPARFQPVALRLHLGQRQQRFGIRWPGREHAVPQPDARPGHVDRPLRLHPPGTGPGRQPGDEENRTDRPEQLPDPRPAVRDPVDRDHFAGGRPDLPADAGARSCRRTFKYGLLRNPS